MRKARQGRAGSAEDAAAARVSAGIGRGDPAALEQFYRSWFGWSFTLVRRLTGRDESFCLDVVQESMLRVARCMKRMNTQADLERWMTRVVHTAALDQLRRESRRLARERRRAIDREAAEDAGTVAELRERAEWVRARLAELPPADGWLVWLRLGRDKTLADSGAAAGVGAQAAHGRVRRAVERMRESSKEAVDESE